MSNICILLGFEPRKSRGDIEEYFKAQTDNYKIGLFIGESNIVDNCVKDNTFVCSFADDNEYDNCEMLLLPDNCSHNGYENLIPFKTRMGVLSSIIECASEFFDHIELFIGDAGANTIEEFEPRSVNLKDLSEFLSNNLNDYNFPAYHLILES